MDPAPPDSTSAQPSAQSPDAEFDRLIQQAATGDAAALHLLASQYEPRVRTVARMLLGRALRPYLDSVDLVQSVHESLLVGLQAGKFEFASQQKMVALAVLMVRRKVAGHWRKLQRQHRMSLVGHADASDIADLVTSAAAPESSPDVALQYREQLERMREQLSEADRTLVSLRLEGFDTAEIARQLSVSQVAARVRLTRLRQRLQATGAMADWL